MPSETATAICSVVMGGVLEQFPRLKLVFAHGGGAFPYLIGRIAHGYDVRPDLCATDNPYNPRCAHTQLLSSCMRYVPRPLCVHNNRKYLSQLYTDSLVHDENALKYLVSTMGEDNVLLGTDYPFPLGEHHPGKLIESVEDWSHTTKVCSNNEGVICQRDTSACFM